MTTMTRDEFKLRCREYLLKLGGTAPHNEPIGFDPVMGHCRLIARADVFADASVQRVGAEVDLDRASVYRGRSPRSGRQPCCDDQPLNERGIAGIVLAWATEMQLNTAAVVAAFPELAEAMYVAPAGDNLDVQQVTNGKAEMDRRDGRAADRGVG